MASATPARSLSPSGRKVSVSSPEDQRKVFDPLDICALKIAFFGFVCFRRQSDGRGRGPQAGAEGAGRRVRLPAEACRPVSHQRQAVLDGECAAAVLIVKKVDSSVCLICFFPQVAHLSRYIQGYRVFYRTIGSSWLVQDVEAASDHSVILTDLQSASEYEVKIRPYFNELQGHDSLMVLLRTPEEGEGSPSTGYHCY